MRTRITKGFTLIELLVVIAIIAILAAILFPVFLGAKKMAMRTTCASNMLQISKAWTMYTDDYGMYPALISEDWTTTWAQMLLPYVRSVQAFGCPAGYVPSSANLLGVSNGGKMSYGWNATIFNYPWLFPVKQSDIDQPSRTIFLCDSTSANWISLPGGLSWRYPYNDPILGPGYECRPPINRHDGIINCAFVDGHARAIPYADLIKTVPNNGRQVAYLDGNQAAHWTRSASISIYPYFAISAQPNQHY